MHYLSTCIHRNSRVSVDTAKDAQTLTRIGV
jgi:hypothetical protein